MSLLPSVCFSLILTSSSFCSTNSFPFPFHSFSSSFYFPFSSSLHFTPSNFIPSFFVELQAISVSQIYFRYYRLLLPLSSSTSHSPPTHLLHLPPTSSTSHSPRKMTYPKSLKILTFISIIHRMCSALSFNMFRHICTSHGVCLSIASCSPVRQSVRLYVFILCFLSMSNMTVSSLSAYHY